MLPSTCSIPFWTAVEPVNEFVPLRMTVPEPFLIKSVPLKSAETVPERSSKPDCRDKTPLVAMTEPSSRVSPAIVSLKEPRSRVAPPESVNETESANRSLPDS